MPRLALVGILLALAVPLHAATKLRKPAHGFQMRVGTYDIQPGEDLEVCEYRRLPIKKPMDVSSFTLRMPSGAHHFAVWKYGGTVQDDSHFPKGPVENVGCVGMVPDDVLPQLLIPTQKPNTRISFPPGVALRLEPSEQVWLNPHMRNFGSTTVAPDIRFNFTRARAGSVRHHAEGLAIGNSTDIRIPAGGDQTLVVEWTSPIDLTVVHLSTHQHRLGTYAAIEVASPDGQSRDQVVTTHDWQHPSGRWWPKGLRIVKGQKMRITCMWHNTDDHEVRFGPETTDEMCFIIGFYYRDPGDTSPVVGSGCLPANKGLLCPLTKAVHD